jgi:hypothetical protein
MVLPGEKLRLNKESFGGCDGKAILGMRENGIGPRFPPGLVAEPDLSENSCDDLTIYDPFFNRSATQSLMMDCRGTPKRFVFLSSCWTIHKGKPTLTRFCSWLGLRALGTPRLVKLLVESSLHMQRVSEWTKGERM